MARPVRGGAGRTTRRTDPTGGLIARTRWRLALVTMGLLTVLLVGVGATTAILALRALDESVDHALEIAVAAEVNRLGGSEPGEGGGATATSSPEAEPAETPGPGAGTEPPEATGQPDSSNPSGSNGPGGSGGGHSGGGTSATERPAASGESGEVDETPEATASRTARPTSEPSRAAGEAPTPPPTRPTAGLTASPSNAAGGTDSDGDREPQAADTFFLYLDSSGNLVTVPVNMHLTGLPDEAAVAAASASGQDLRTVTVGGGVRVRLLTEKLSAADEQTSGVAYLQAGFVLTLRDEQAATLLRTIAIVGLIGLAGAAALTFVITGRALVPIRSAFARERRFVATSSHELRTPIALIRSTAEVLDREDLVKPGGEPFVADILAEADRLGRLVADLSTLATAQAGPVEPPVPIDLAALVVDTVRRAGPMAAERGVVLEGPIEPQPVRVMGQGDPLMQVALILIDNAIKVTRPGGHVRVSVERRAGFGELIVEDEGMGIPEADRERIFEPFARLDGGSRDDGGSGLGLAIARAITRRLGGSITVGDSPAGGARFVVSVPLA